jgi:hypothetical protein
VEALQKQIEAERMKNLDSQRKSLDEAIATGYKSAENDVVDSYYGVRHKRIGSMFMSAEDRRTRYL